MLRRLILFLALGAIANIAVAWSGALFAPTKLHDQDTQVEPIAAWHAAPPADWPLPDSRSINNKHFAFEAELRWRLLTTETEDAQHRRGLFMEVQRGGFPFAALSCTRQIETVSGSDIDWETNEVIRGGWIPPLGAPTPADAGWYVPPLVFPLRPSPIGFFANTAIYGAILWSPFGFWRLRRRPRPGRAKPRGIVGTVTHA